MEMSKISKMLVIYLLFFCVLVEFLGIQICAGVPEFTFCYNHKTFFMNDNLCNFFS